VWYRYTDTHLTKKIREVGSFCRFILCSHLQYTQLNPFDNLALIFSLSPVNVWPQYTKAPNRESRSLVDWGWNRFSDPEALSPDAGVPKGAKVSE